MLQFNSRIGPVIKIVSKMFHDFMNFSMLYFLLVMMFAILGNINFLLFISEYKDFLHSILMVVDTSLGNYKLTIFDIIKDPVMKELGIVFTICILICFKIVVLNLIIAILANTYNTFDTKSNGLYLSKILNIRDEMTYDESFGAFLAAVPPFNFL